MSFRPHMFGRYTILDPVAVGGMAEIYRARLTNSGEGPDRILIMKKVIQSLSQDDEFVQMFEEEIKITVGLSNPNIVQIYDYGRVSGVSFLAMEYVEGKNLQQFLKRLISMKSMFSIDMSCHIVSQVTQALGYAHAFRDRMTGEHLGIVHRDISPQNILISYDGAVKLFDFGIAKAKSALQATQVGVIKGKPSYLSPEQISGEVLDGRSDIFSMGIVLWEMLTAKRLFVADNDLAVLHMIQSAKIEPPSTYNPSIPQSLDAIVLRSLARDRDKRYHTGEEFQRDLHRFLYSHNLAFNPADLSYYATELFKKEIQEDRERLRASLKLTPDPGLSDSTDPAPDSPQEGGAAKEENSKTLAKGLMLSSEYTQLATDALHNTKKTSVQQEVKGNADITKKAQHLEEPGQEGAPSEASSPAASGPGGENLVVPPWKKQPEGGKKRPATGFVSAAQRKRGGTRKVAQPKVYSYTSDGSGVMKFLGGGAIALFILLVIGTYVAPKEVCGLTEVFEGSPIEEYLGCEAAKRELADICEFDPRGPSCARVCVGARQSEPCRAFCAENIFAQVCRADNKKRKVLTDKSYTEVTLETNVEDYEVMLNGLKALVMSGDIVLVAVGESVTLKLRKPGYDTVERVLNLEDDSPTSIQILMEKTQVGFLTFLTNPGADITLRAEGREPLSLYTPLKKHEVPIGNYTVEIENEAIGHKSEVSISIKKGQHTEVQKNL